MYRCPACLKAKNVLADVKTTICLFCNKRFKTALLTCFFESDELEKVVEIVGRLNAEKNGEMKRFMQQLVATEKEKAISRDRKHFDTPHQYVAFRLKSASGDRLKVRRAMRLLTDELGSFTLQDLRLTLSEAGRDPSKAEEYIERMVRENALVTRGGKESKRYELIG